MGIVRPRDGAVRADGPVLRRADVDVPPAGAEYDYTRRVLPARWAFVVGWTMATGLMVAAAAIAVGFAHYLRYFVDVPVVAAAVALLVMEAGIALAGMRRSARLTLALSALQVAGLLFVIVIGASHVGSESLVAGSALRGVLGGAALVFFAFIGFDEVITLAEETKHPTRLCLVPSSSPSASRRFCTWRSPSRPSASSAQPSSPSRPARSPT